MQADIQTFLTTFGGAGLMETINLRAVLKRWGYKAPKSWCTYTTEDLVAKYGEDIPVWMLAGVLMNAGGTFKVVIPDKAFHTLFDAFHNFACGRETAPLLDAAFSAMNPHIAANNKAKSEAVNVQ